VNYFFTFSKMDILTLGWVGVLGVFTLSIAFVVWGRNGL
jgi:cytochrome b6-f complex subunit 8